MAEQQQTDKQSSRRISPLLTLLILLGVLCMQVGVIAGAYWMWGGPSEVKANPAAEDQAAQAEQPVEVLIVDSKFQNTRTGRSYLYDTEVYIVTARKHQDRIKDRLESRQAQVVTEIATIIRRAERSHFHEPELSTLTRQIRAALERLFGEDEEGESYIDEVLIKQMTEFQT